MMARLIAVLSGLLCATNALRPQTRHQFLQNVIKGAALATPIAASASTRDYTPADEDMKGLLSSFTTELYDKDKKAAQKKLDAVWKSTTPVLKTPRHRADAATETASRRWRGAPKILISTQVGRRETPPGED